MSKKTLVLGASPNISRYSNRAIKKLVAHGHEVYAIAKRATTIDTVEVQTGHPKLQGVHTVTLYLNPDNQEEYLDYIIRLKPRRIIFNPGTWNPKLLKLAREAGIETEEDCTLVMLDMDLF